MNELKRSIDRHGLLRLSISLVVWALYAMACILPAIQSKGDVANGWTALRFGWMVPWVVIWSANVYLAIGWILLLCGRYLTAAGWSAAAVGTGALFLLFDELASALIGYWFWLASPLVLAVGAGLLWLRMIYSGQGDVT